MGERNLGQAVGDAVADIRSKLIDEGWFGRRGPSAAVTPSGWPPLEPEPHHPRLNHELGDFLSFDEAWATREPADGRPERDKELGLDI
jgi:hypothetical protein